MGNLVNWQQFGLKKDVAEAREQVKRGKVYTHKQVLKELGIS